MRRFRPIIKTPPEEFQSPAINCLQVDYSKSRAICQYIARFGGKGGSSGSRCLIGRAGTRLEEQSVRRLLFLLIPTGWGGRSRWAKWARLN